MAARPLTDAALVRAAIEASGGNPDDPAARRRFAALSGRDEQTIRIWLRGGTVPPLARAWMARLIALPERTRRTIVRALTPSSAA